MSVVVSGAGAVTALGADPAGWTTPGRPGAALTLELGALAASVRTRVERAERVTQLLAVAVARALEQAGLAEVDGPPRGDVGIVVGTAFGCFLTNAAYQRRLAAGGTAAASPRLFAATVSNAAAGELGIGYRLGGPTITLTAGAASGSAAVGCALDLVRRGRVAAVVAAGADAFGAPLDRWLADGGLAAGRPTAEAAAAVVLEPARRAEVRGVRALGTLDGYATGFCPDPAAGHAPWHALLTHALADAGAAGSDVDVVVHGAPPAQTDDEAAAVRAVVGGDVQRLLPKERLGETFGAAGVLGALAALAAGGRGPGLVLDACASGHLGALVLRGAPA